MDRRDFVRTLGAALALPAAAHAALPAPGAPRARIGIQLYTLRDAARQALAGTLAAIARIGYTDVELLDSMQNFGMPAARLRPLLDRLHLRAPSTHLSGEAFDDIERHFDDAHTLGHEYLVLASLPGERPTLDDYRRWADRLNAAGEAARRAKLWIAFHDEANDFRAIDGQVPYDVLVERTDPKLVRLQLDTGNAGVGGRDPLPYLERYRDRYWLFHIKDVPQLGASQDVELGKGVIDFARLLRGIPRIGEKHLFVEQESYPGAPIDSARRDYAYFAALRRKLGR